MDKIDTIQLRLHYACGLVDTVAMTAQYAEEESISDGLMVLAQYLHMLHDEIPGLLDEEVPASA